VFDLAPTQIVGRCPNCDKHFGVLIKGINRLQENLNRKAKDLKTDSELIGNIQVR
jgi:hypothetical protein